MNSIKNFKIAVFMGGISSEREVSLRTGAAILNSLKKQGYSAYKVDLNEENILNAFTENEYDLAYLALHGEFGEDGRIQSILDILSKPYTGSGVTASAVAMDKILTKKIAFLAGIRVPKTYITLEEIDEYPVIIKPAKEGSSVGLYLCKNKEAAEQALIALKSKKPIIEEFIEGEELTSGVINGESLGVLRIKPLKGIYDYEAKYSVGGSIHEYPAKIEKNAYDEAVNGALKIHEELGLEGISRSDFILKDGKCYFLEVNTCPGMTETSLIPELGTIKGYVFDDLVRKMVETFVHKNHK
ncbi:MAG: D-alanine--D-alanine ligase [Fusobacteriaceae bacterium]